MLLLCLATARARSACGSEMLFYINPLGGPPHICRPKLCRVYHSLIDRLFFYVGRHSSTQNIYTMDTKMMYVRVRTRTRFPLCLRTHHIFGSDCSVCPPVKNAGARARGSTTTCDGSIPMLGACRRFSRIAARVHAMYVP